MFTMSSGRLPDLPMGTAAGEHAAGNPAGSGMVPASSPIKTDPDQGGRHDDLGRHPIQSAPQPTSDLDPIPGVVTRPMLGGLRTAFFSGLLRESEAFHGGHLEIRNRRAVVVLAPAEQAETAPAGVLPSLRVPPVSDPYGRMCVNAAAKKAAGQ